MFKRLIAILAASCSTMAIANETSWTVSEMSGSVHVSHRGLSRVATRGLSVTAGDTVTTGPGARAVLVRGSEYMMVASGSRLQLQPEAQASGFTQMIEEFGNVVFMIKKKTTPHFEVRTPYLAAVVKGTTFAVGVTPQGASVEVLEGAVEVATGDGGAHDLLRPGSVAIVGARDLYRMRIETNGVTKIVVSPAAGKEPARILASQVNAPVSQVAVSTVPIILAAVYEAPVSLDSVTGGLVNGTTGGHADVADLTNAIRTATEASTSAVKAVEAVKMSVVASAEQDRPGATADTSAQAANGAAQAKASGGQAAQAAPVVAQRAADAAAQASTDNAKSSSNAAAAMAAADAAAKAASAAADAATRAEADRAASAATQAATQAAADQAAKDAAKAAADALSASGNQAAQAAADKAAKDAAKTAAAQAAADQTAKDAAKAAQDALKAANDKAVQAAADNAAKAAADLANQQNVNSQGSNGADAAAKAAADAMKAAKKVADAAAKAALDALKGK